MRQSHLFGRTLREAPSDAQTPGHQLMLRAAIARPLAAGLYTLLPLGFRVAKKVERIIREEMDRIGCQEMEMPVLAPADLWKETGRWDLMDDHLFKLRDHGGREFLVSYTHEEVVTHHARNEIQSYRQLPVMVYHFRAKGRDEARPRAGLLRVREFVMKDAYSIDADWGGLRKSYQLQHDAYQRIFDRSGVRAIAVEGDAGLMGGDIAHEFQVLTDAGEDVILICTQCDHRANREAATRRVDEAVKADRLPAPEPFHTPQTTTIEQLRERYGFAPSDLLKTVLLRSADGVVAVVVPGDREVSEPKLRRILGVGDIKFANEADFAAAGGVAGYVGPVGLKARTLVDVSVEPRAYVAGANQADHHLRNVVPGRDFDGERVDAHDVRSGDHCPKCGGLLEAKRGIEVGNIFQLGTYYSSKMNATYLAEDGTRKVFVMGSYGIGVGRLVQTIIETHRDDRGILWPISVAPFETHVVALPMKDEAVRATAEALVADLEREGVEVLYDDRDESAGVKFADADLIGIPFRVTVSARGLKAGTVEVKPRERTEVENVPAASAVARIATLVREARARYS
ncbi:MAG: proline--tRNA ligase [Chloroflexi bacterium]|nr:proline--tRNA ligase [Chloroflexota bacterium]MBI2982816.1 proline--tRNA ligase [Chloroflexota bacterium]